MIVGGGDTAIVTTRSHEVIRAHVRVRMSAAKRLPGFIFCLAGETPSNVPTESLRVYFEACKEYGGR